MKTQFNNTSITDGYNFHLPAIGMKKWPADVECGFDFVTKCQYLCCRCYHRSSTIQINLDLVLCRMRILLDTDLGSHISCNLPNHVRLVS
jgi:hypothetical protein